MNYLQKELYELVQSETTVFDFIQEAALDGLWYWDLEKPRNEWMNAKFWTCLGYDPAQMPHKASSWQNIIHPEDLKTSLVNFEEHCINPEHAYDQEVRYTHKNGSTVWIRCRGMAIRDKNGKAIRMLGAHIDITKEKNREHEEKLKNNVLQSTMESYKDVLIFSIDTQYRYLVFNTAFKLATFNAYGTEVARGISMLESITNPEDRKKAKDNCDRAFAGEAHVTNEVYGDINRFYFETRYNPILNDDNEITSITVMSSNVTERKQAEEQLLALNKELESFSYSVSHDLRAPLRAVNGYVQMLNEDYGPKLDEDGKRLMEKINYNAKRMGMLIDDLLAFSRLGRKEILRADIDMNQLTEQVISEIDRSMVHNAKIHVGKLHPIKGDFSLFRQVMFNLISNAVKYSSKRVKPVIEITSEEKEGDIIFCIKDNGAGFDMKYADKLFGVFQRLHTDKDFEGTGVGLAIVQRIVSRHGGKVWAEGKVDKGATFNFSMR